MEVCENLLLENIDGELWKEIEGYNGYYYVSNLGRVKSFKCGKEKILKQNEDKDGYFAVSLRSLSDLSVSKNGEGKTKQIHTLMYETFIEEIPKGYIVHHIDFTKNNILENFQTMTKKEHDRLHNKGENNPMFGSKRPGEKSGHHTLTEQKVIKIRRLCDEGNLTQKEIGEKFGVRRETISNIKTGRTWKHLNERI